MGIILFFLCMLVSGLYAGNTFEGNLTLTSEKNGIAGSKTVLAVKNDLVAIDPGKGPQAVLNVSTGDFFTVVDQGGQKIVAKMNVGVLSDLPELPAFLNPFSNYLGKENPGSEVTSTEEVKIINGYKCRKYVIKDEEATTTLWAAQDFPFSLAALMDLLKVNGSMNAALESSFPMKAIIKNNKTSEVSGFNVTVEKKTIDEKLFALPADLLVMDMTPLIRQMLQTNDPAQIKKVLDNLMPR